mmetsp:Transcript_175592/g.427004  ORF Transcript_175592/g.427004 Transcript_175592/m.427004 type:complete len:127 (+) Transcript_175592:18-398(+)
MVGMGVLKPLMTLARPRIILCLDPFKSLPLWESFRIQPKSDFPSANPQQYEVGGVATPAQACASSLPMLLQLRQPCEHQLPKRHWSLQWSTPYWPAFTKHAAQEELMPAFSCRQELMRSGWKLNQE